MHVLIAFLLAATAPTAWQIDAETSLFAVVTHKEGLAAGLAHEHLVVAAAYDARLAFDREQPGSADFAIEVPVAELLIDDPALESAWQDDLLERKLIGEGFAELSEKDRKKIHKSMLSEAQLDVENHPTLSARVSRVERVEAEGDSYRGVLELTLLGRSVTRQIQFSAPGDNSLTLDLVMPFTFTEFGIEPYSALFGAIRVADEFHLVVRLVASR